MDTLNSQKEAIKKHLTAGGTLTALDALRLFCCMRLAPRIQELRDEGLNIITETVKQEGKSFARYSYQREQA